MQHPGWTSHSYFRELSNNFWVTKNLNSLMRIRIQDPESFWSWNSDPGWKNSDPRSRIRNTDPLADERILAVLSVPPPLEHLCEPPGWRCRLTECLSEDNTRDLIRVLIEADRAIRKRKVVHHWISLTYYGITYRIHKEKQLNKQKLCFFLFCLLQNT